MFVVDFYSHNKEATPTTKEYSDPRACFTAITDCGFANYRKIEIWKVQEQLIDGFIKAKIRTKRLWVMKQKDKK